MTRVGCAARRSRAPRRTAARSRSHPPSRCDRAAATQLAAGHGDVLGRPAGLGHSDRSPSARRGCCGRCGSSGTRGSTGTGRRPPGHRQRTSSASGPNATTRPANSCPGITGRDGRELAVEDVQVGAAEPAGGDLDYTSPGPGVGSSTVSTETLPADLMIAALT